MTYLEQEAPPEPRVKAPCTVEKKTCDLFTSIAPVRCCTADSLFVSCYVCERGSRLWIATRGAHPLPGFKDRPTGLGGRRTLINVTPCRRILVNFVCDVGSGNCTTRSRLPDSRPAPNLPPLYKLQFMTTTACLNFHSQNWRLRIARLLT